MMLAKFVYEVIFVLFFGLYLLFKSSLAMLERGKILFFLPIFLLSIAGIIEAVFVFNDLYETGLWLANSIFIILLFSSIVIILAKNATHGK